MECLLKAGETHEPWHLPGDNVDSRACHETADGGRWDELDYPSKTQQADAKHNESTEECDSRCYFGSCPHSGVRSIDMFDDLRYRKRHDSDGADGHIL